MGTPILELGAPLALLGHRLRYAWALGTFGMHWGIWAIMGITFWYHLTGLAFLPFLVDDVALGWCRGQWAHWWHRHDAPAAALTEQAAPRGSPLPDPG